MMYVLYIYMALLVGENAVGLKKKTCLMNHGAGRDKRIQIQLHIGEYTIRVCRIFWFWSGVMNVNGYYAR